MRRREALQFGALAPAALAQYGWAQPSGAGPTKLVVAFSPGGGSDNVARIMATRLAAVLGDTFIVENKPGASTNLANEQVARAKPDGKTLLLGQVTLSINPTLMPNLSYVALQDLVPVAHVGDSPVVLVTSPKFPPRDLRSLIAYVRERPGKINFASGGNGTSVHLAGELFKQRTHLDMLHIPYKGSSQMVADLIGGDVHMIFNTAPSVVPFVKAGTIRAIAVSGERRLLELPDIATFTEAGLPNFDAPSWYGIMAPKGTPANVVMPLNKTLEAIIREPDTRENLERIGVDPVGGTPADFAEFLKAQQTLWANVIKVANIRIEQ